MKKFLLVGMTVLLLGLTAACSAQPAAPAGGEASVPPAEQKSAAPDGETEQQEGNTYMGKVSSLVGNEVELELGEIKLPDTAAGDGGNGGISITPAAGGTTVTTVHSGTEEGTAAAPNKEAEAPQVFAMVEDANGNAQVINFSGIGEEGSGIEMEYNGETKSLTIPAGAKIHDFTGGETALSAIKKGSVLAITTTGTGENETVTDITIMG